MELELTTSYTAPASTFGNPIWWLLGSSVPLAWIVFVVLVAFLPQVVKNLPLAVVWYIGSIGSMLMLAFSLTYGPGHYVLAMGGVFLISAAVWNLITFVANRDRSDVFRKAKYASAMTFVFISIAFWTEASLINLQLPLFPASMLWWGVSFFTVLSLFHWLVGVVRLTRYLFHQIVGRLKKEGPIRITRKGWPHSF